MSGPLAGVRVLDLGYFVAAPFATRILADYGADVIKVEPPGGEPGRLLRPFLAGEPGVERSGLFAALNLNKRSVILDITTDADRRKLLALARTADVVVESAPPGALAAVGLGYEAFHAEKAEIVVASLTSFGQTGPWRDYRLSDTVLYAMGGAMYAQGSAERAPLRQVPMVSLLQVGAMTAGAIQAAILWQRRTGEGQWLDLSMYEMQSASAAFRVQMYMVYQFSKHIHPRRESAADLPAGAGVFRCADGYIEVYTPPQRWDRLVALLGDPPELREERWLAPGARQTEAYMDAFNVHWLPWLLERTKYEAWDALQGVGILSGPLNTVADLAEDPVFQQRGFWAGVEHAALGRLRMPGRPFQMIATPWELRRASPLLGEHTDEVLREVGV